MSDSKIDALKRVEIRVERMMFSSRWLLAPFFVGLIGALLLLLIMFMKKLAATALGLVGLLGYEAITSDQLVVNTLSLVDMALIGSLLLMIIFSGYEIFVSKIDVVDHEDRPNWMGQIDFSGLKLKLIGAIVAISAIELLREFMELQVGTEVSTQNDLLPILVKIAIHVTFVISGLLFAIMDKIAATTPTH